MVLNTRLPSSSLKQENYAVAHHRVRGAVAAGVVKVQHIDGKEEIAPIHTMAIDGSTFRNHLKNTVLVPL